MQAIKKEFTDVTARDVVSWHRPMVSGAVFAALFAIWAIFVFADYTLITFISRIASIALIVGAAAALTKRTIARSPEDMTACMDRAYETVRPHITKSIDSLVSIMTWRDCRVSAKFFFATLITAFLGNWMKDTTLMLMALLMAFSVPVLYEKNQKEIDRAMAQVEAITQKYLGMVKTQAESKRSAVEAQLDQMMHKNQ